MNNQISQFFRPLKAGEAIKLTTTITSFPLDVATMMETQRRNMQAFASMQQMFLEGLQVIAHRQTAMLADITADQANMAREWVQSDTPEDKIADQALIMKHLYERTISHLREINDMVNQSSHETSNVMHKRVASTLAEVKDAIDRAKAKRAA